MDFKSQIQETKDKIKHLETFGKNNIETLNKLNKELQIMTNELIKERIKLEVLIECEQKEV